MASWIFLRGLTRGTAHWGRFPDEFRRAVPNSRVIPLDLPGNGALNRVPSPLSITGMVSYCRNELLRRGEKPPYYLLAMSLGAMVAAEWSYQYPNEVAGCVLINTSFRPISPFYRRLRPHNYLSLLRLALLRSAPSDRERTILQMTSNKVASHAQVIPDWIETRLEHPVKEVNALRQLMAAASYRVPAAPPPAEVLLLASAQDKLVNVECSLAIATKWNCSLELHPSAGHDLPLDAPLWVTEQVRNWLRARSGVATES